MSREKQKRINSIYEKKPDNLTYLPVDMAATAINEYLFARTEFDKSKLSFYSLLGISYYLSKENLTNLIKGISNAVCSGSAIVFDYPDQDTYTDKAGKRLRYYCFTSLYIEKMQFIH